MLRISKGVLLKSIGMFAFAASTPVIAHTYERCDPDGDHCVRITCDHDGDRCWSQSEYGNRDIYNPPGRWVCDSDGDRCHYEYSGRKWNPHWDHDHDHGHDHEHERDHDEDH